MGNAVFQVYRDDSEAREWRFRLVDEDGDNVLKSEGYPERRTCVEGIASVKENAPKDEQYKRSVASDGKHYFNLKGGNGEIVGTGEMCDDEAERDHKIEVVKRIAPKAELLEA